MRIASFGSILSSTYTDTMNIYRHISIINDDGTKGIEMPKTPIYADVKCRISFENKDYPQSNMEDANPIRLAIKVFCGPEVNVHKGDKLIIKRLDESGNIMMTYEGIANLPFTYTTHKEIEIVKVGDA